MRTPNRMAWGRLALLALSGTLVACGTTVPLARQGGQALGNQSAAGPAGLGAVSDSGSGEVATGGPTGLPGDGTAAAGGVAAGPTGAGSSVGSSVVTGSGPVTGSVASGGTTTGVTAPGRKSVAAGGGKATSSSQPGTAKTAPTSGPKAGTKSGTTGQASVVNGPGITPTTISIGFPYSSDADAGLASVGVNLDQGNVLDEVNAFATAINKGGGIAGRTVKIVPYDYGNDTNGDSVDTQEQAACTALTQDTPTAAILAGSNAVFLNCTAKAGILSFGTDSGGISLTDYNANPQRFDVEAFPVEPTATDLVNELSRDGYLSTKWDTNNAGPGGLTPVKIGILYNDTAEQGAFVKTLLAALKAKGNVPDPGDIIQYTQSSSASSAGAEIAAIQASVLQMRSDGVTNFIPVDSAAMGFFATNANSQKYYPRYAMTSINDPQVGVNDSLVPAKTLTGALGYGWLPSLDLTNFSAFANAGQPQCRKALSDSGIPDTPNSFQEAEAFGFCDDLNVFKRGVESVAKGQPINVRTVIAGIDALGTGFPFANLPSGLYATGRNYPVYQGYPLAWDAGCTCAKYTGPAYKL